MVANFSIINIMSKFLLFNNSSCENIVSQITVKNYKSHTAKSVLKTLCEKKK